MFDNKLGIKDDSTKYVKDRCGKFLMNFSLLMFRSYAFCLKHFIIMIRLLLVAVSIRRLKNLFSVTASPE